MTKIREREKTKEGTNCRREKKDCMQDKKSQFNVNNQNHSSKDR